MSTFVSPVVEPEILYPENDGKPMAENTEQFRWIVTIHGNLDALLPDAFVAGDLFWYPIKGQPETNQSPDVMVAFGRPKGKRKSYRQWEEDNVAPQVVFEILSPSNTRKEMSAKFEFYQEHGVEEYYVYDPSRNQLFGWERHADLLLSLVPMHGWVSTRLGIRFELGDELEIYFPDGKRFRTFAELKADEEAARKQAEEALQRAEAAEERARKLAERLRSMGIDPDAEG